MKNIISDNLLRKKVTYEYRSLQDELPQIV